MRCKWRALCLPSTAGELMTRARISLKKRRTTVRIRIRAVTLLAALVAMVTATLASPAAASSSSTQGRDVLERQRAAYLFSDSARTVQCAIVEADADDPLSQVRCDTVGTPTWQAPPKPSDCSSEWGNSVGLGTYDVPYYNCVGDSLHNTNQLPAGTVVDRGDLTCVILAPGVRCRQKQWKNGFEVSLDRFTVVRPPARELLTASGLGKLKLGMSVKKARATGYLKPGTGMCGPAQLKRRWRNTFTTWRNDRLWEVSAFPGTNVNTRRGAGPGSTVAEMLALHPEVRGPFAAPVLSDTGTLWVYLQRTKRGVLVFVLDGPSANRQPVAQDLVRSIFAAKKWKPRTGLASGC